MTSPAEPASLWLLRPAEGSDVLALTELIRLSVHGLQVGDYGFEHREAALGPVFGVDERLIADGTYFVATVGGKLIAAGGWSCRPARFGGHVGRRCGESEAKLDPTRDAARIRAFFVHPDWARRGLGRALLRRCETELRAAGFRSTEIVATLAGERLYAAAGYRVTAHSAVALPGGLELPVVHMAYKWSEPADSLRADSCGHP